MNKIIHNLIMKIGETNSDFTEIQLKKMEYGLLCIFSDLTKAIVYFVLFFLVHLEQYFIISLVFFCPLRLFLGGYHADTYLRCFFMSFIIFLISILTGKFLAINIIATIILQTISLILVIVFAPVDNVNKPIKSIQRRNKLKFYSVIITSILIVLCFLIPKKFLTTALISIVNAVIMMILGLINNNYNNKSNISNISINKTL
ncbi:MAG: accessory gene regulator B family protein [Bacillota bacterium]|nr:accessory gene regulator B family protein [Bacillota bacterium]